MMPLPRSACAVDLGVARHPSLPPDSACAPKIVAPRPCAALAHAETARPGGGSGGDVGNNDGYGGNSDFGDDSGGVVDNDGGDVAAADGVVDTVMMAMF